MGKVNKKEVISSSNIEQDKDDNAKASDYLSTVKGIDGAQTYLNNQNNWKSYDKIPGADETIRQRYGSQYSQNSAKDRAFKKGHKVRDSHTGKELCKTVEEAKSKYGADWADHVAESDHVVPVKHVYEKHKKDTWLTQDDIKEVINDPENFQQLSKKNNTTKGSRTEREYLDDKNNGLKISKKKRERIIKDSDRINNKIETKLTIKKAKNIASTFHESGSNSVKNSAAEIGLLNILTNLKDVLDDRKTMKDAMKDVVTDTGSGLVKNYTFSGAVTIAQRSLQESEIALLKWASKFNLPAKIVSTVQVCFSPIKKYLNNEITMSECTQQITKASAELMITGEAAVIGQTLIPIPVVGAVAGTLVGMAFSKCLFGVFDSMATNKQIAAEMRNIQEKYKQMYAQYHEYRVELEKTLASYFAKEKKFYTGCMKLLDEGIFSDDNRKVSEAARNITHHLGGTDSIETIDDLCALLDG